MALKETVLFSILFSYPKNSFAARNSRRKSVVVRADMVADAGARRTRRPQNVEGEFFVDHTCIDCDTCRWMAPETFTLVDCQSAVTKQPSSQEGRILALQALLACPTASIHTEKPPKEIKEVQKMFPLPIDEEKLPGVYHCGFHSERSFGAASYLVVHPDGNILVDSPRFTEILARKIEMHGGVRHMFLTHKDDVGEHDKWAKRFGCERILHSGDIERSTEDVEVQLQGSGPWSIGSDFELIHTPGHTEGSVCLYYKPLKVLFTGDHFAKSEMLEFSIFERYNKVSVNMQLESVRKLLDLDFKWILPGHGRRAEFRDNKDKNIALKTFLDSKQRARV